MKILLIIPFFYPHVGGNEKYSEDLYANLKKQHPEVEIDVLCYNTNAVAAYEKYRDLNIYRIPCLNLLPDKFVLPHPIRLVQKLNELSKRNYNFVNTHTSFFDPTIWAWIYAKLIGAQSIFTGHTTSLASDKNFLINWPAKIIDWVWGKTFLRFYDLITVVSRASGEFHHKTFGVKNYQVIYGAVDTNFYSSTKSSSEREIFGTDWKLSSDDILISYVGRLIDMKGLKLFLEVIVEILNKLENKNKKIYFVLAGSGELKDQLSQQIKEKNLEKQIYLPGELDSSAVKNLLAATNIFVYPSYREGFPIALLEAGVSECCVIASNVGGINELIQDQKTGFLVIAKSEKSLKEALWRAINNEILRIQLGRNLKHLIEQRFTWSRVSEKYYQILKPQKLQRPCF